MSSVVLIRETQYGSLNRQLRHVDAQVTLGLTTEAIHPEDLNLQTMDMLIAVPTNPSAGTVSLTRGSVVNAYLFAPGSYKSAGNLGSIQALGLGNLANGTASVSLLSGSVTVNVMADGW